MFSNFSRLEFVDITGLRLDGRRAEEVRQTTFSRVMVPGADGAVFLQQGGTHVLASVWGPREVVRKSSQKHDRCTLSCNVTVAPYAGNDRKQRSRRDTRCAEHAAALQSVFESALFVDKYPRAEIRISVHVMQIDGSVRCACINAASMALICAGLEMRDTVCACSAGILDATIVADLTQSEENACDGHIVVAAMPKSSFICHVNSGPKVTVDRFLGVLQAATEGCSKLGASFRVELLQLTSRLIQLQDVQKGE